MSSTTLRLPKEAQATHKHAPSERSVSARIWELRRLNLVLLTLSITLATAYSIQYNTYLDTSDPILASLPHPSASKSYFARKSNIFNQLFVKKAWGWTSLAFFVIMATSPPEKRTRNRWMQWVIATLVWAGFASWFFGPALFERFVVASGGQCVIAFQPIVPVVGGGDVKVMSMTEAKPLLINVPIEYCHTKTSITTSSHPHLFTHLLTPPPGDKLLRPRLYHGHDVSGHLFLLTLCILFLTDQVILALQPRPFVTQTHSFALNVVLGLLAIWWWMAIMTAVYFHSPQEKISGFLIGLAGFALTLIPLRSRPAPKVGVPIPDNKLRVDAMRLD